MARKTVSPALTAVGVSDRLGDAREAAKRIRAAADLLASAVIDKVDVDPSTIKDAATLIVAVAD